MDMRTIRCNTPSAWVGESCFLDVCCGAVWEVVLLLLLIAKKRFTSEVEHELGIGLGMSWLRPAWFSSLLYPTPRALHLVSYRPPGFSVEDETCVRDMDGRPRSQHALTHNPQHTPNVPSRTFHAQHDHCGGLRLYRAQLERSLYHYPTSAAPMSCRAPCIPKCERAFG